MALSPAPLHSHDGPRAGRAYWVQASDGVRLRVGHWPGQRGTVLVLPGRTEYIEKYAQVAADLARDGWGALVIDWRGQGLSDRLCDDPRLGHVGRFCDYQRDLAALRAAADALGCTTPAPILCHSMGGCIAFRALCDGLIPPAIAFSAPMWGLPIPPTRRFAIRALALVLRPLGRDSRYLPTTGPDYGLPAMEYPDNPLTRDQAQFARMKAQVEATPALALGGPSLRWGAAALSEMAALARETAPCVPALIGLGGNERVVTPEAIRRRVGRWPDAELVEYPEAEHELLMERPAVRADFLARVRSLFNRA
ncbi:MAG: lysophospholipase [Rhodobacteraceae bacterium HLUCCA12]|nr:MAG: lysophospholipase [Rhodobacteraceae bacterium HLUCCA12]